MKKRRILVLCGGPSGEHAVSLKSGVMVMKHLDRKKYSVTKATIRRDGKWVIARFARTQRQALKFLRGRFDVVFISMHGFFGEDGKLQSLLESVKLSYTGSGVTASALAMDKHRTNLKIARAGLAVPAWKIVKRKLALPLGLPFVIKPVNGGSSVDTAIIRTVGQYRVFMKKVAGTPDIFMAQKFIAGRELTCGVLERNGHPFSLPVTEIRPKSSSWFDFKAKYQVGGSKEITPAPLTKSQTKKIQSLALKAHTILGCSGMSRSDFILADGKFWYLETNTIPGLTTTSLLPQAAKAAKISFSTMLDLIITSAHRAPRLGVVK